MKLGKRRRPTREDEKRIREIAQTSRYPIPERWERAIVYEVEGNQIVAFGTLRKNLEAVMVVDQGASLGLRGKALINLMKQAIEDAQELSFEDIYVFAQDEEFAKVLEKHFKFRRIDTIPMILELNDGE